jgi:hypothetical protein
VIARRPVKARGGRGLPAVSVRLAQASARSRGPGRPSTPVSRQRAPGRPASLPAATAATEAFPQPPLPPPVGDRGDRQQVVQDDGVAPALRAGQEEDLLLDVRGEQRQRHDLADPRPRHARPPDAAGTHFLTTGAGHGRPLGRAGPARDPSPARRGPPSQHVPAPTAAPDARRLQRLMARRRFAQEGADVALLWDVPRLSAHLFTLEMMGLAFPEGVRVIWLTFFNSIRTDG